MSHHDQLGSTRLLTDNSGAVVGSMNYDPYGAPTATIGTVSTPLRYTGQYTEIGNQAVTAPYANAAEGQGSDWPELSGVLDDAATGQGNLV